MGSLEEACEQERIVVPTTLTGGLVPNATGIKELDADWRQCRKAEIEQAGLDGRARR